MYADMKSLIRQNIKNITPYVAGKPIEETKRQLGLKRVIKLASNENPLGASPLALKAIKKSLSGINRYPDSQSFYLKRKLARSLNLEPANVILGNGSDELIDIIVKTFVEDDEIIITADTTFLEYDIISRVNNRRVIKVPLKYFKYDLETIKRKINFKTKLIFIANPNNPTGTYLSRKEIDGFIRSLPGNVVLVLDEAYDTFIDVADFPDSLKYVKSKNVIVLKTFSKAFGLAGLRIGYALANSDFVSCMERVRQPFNVNILAQAAAEAALDDRMFIKKTRRLVLDGKKYLYAELKKMGLAYLPSVANFILIDVGRDSPDVFKSMLKYGVIVRDMLQYGLNNFIRVTIGTKKENERFIRVIKKVLGHGS
jgi:histidinol-phosphate aminotransferase